MNPQDLAKPPSESLSSRFALVGYLPTFAAAWYLLTLVWAGAPGGPLDFGRVWRTASTLGLGQLTLIILTILLVAVLAAPLQMAMVRTLEGRWPRLLGSGVARGRQLRRKHRLERAAELPASADPETAGSAAAPEAPSPAVLQRAGQLGAQLRRSFPMSDHLVRPTRLGNILAAMEDTAGRTYGLDGVIAWPRLYPQLSDRTRALVDDRRDMLDAAARLAVTSALVTVIGTALLLGTGWWQLLSLIPLGMAALAHAGTVQAAHAYAEVVHVAFDLHRFDLLKALHMPLPTDPAREATVNRALCDMWRQGVPADLHYLHTGENNDPTQQA
ncbi:hypothetical protein [Actinomadura decatromicini]|uniref:Uncharacterized protein n=1 Tax=Actinomadura decatromicini TaxID=2604572 RepID=A0A5D3FYV8_9ACTN|nr:hypothetical protein [Actinomadura decatromicini]TYK53116.1 hypothetical protein FXF68_05150 [Actinomadura decatromicini]